MAQDMTAPNVGDVFDGTDFLLIVDIDPPYYLNRYVRCLSFSGWLGSLELFGVVEMRVETLLAREYTKLHWFSAWRYRREILKIARKKFTNRIK